MCSTHFDLLSSVSFLSLPVRFPGLRIQTLNTRIFRYLCLRIQTLNVRFDEICVFKLLSRFITYIIKCEIHRIFIGPLGIKMISLLFIWLACHLGVCTISLSSLSTLATIYYGLFCYCMVLLHICLSLFFCLFHG